MKIKLTALLISTIFASANQASRDIEQACGADRLRPCVQQTEGVVPDSFSCVREYRLRKADLEVRLDVLKDVKLKVFTPQVFSEMLKEAVEIANLGFCIYESLPQIASNINIQLHELETKIKTKNALVSWKKLRELIERVERFNLMYWKEFEFDFERTLDSAGLQPQVLRAHQSALFESQAWMGIKDKRSCAHVSQAFTSEYCQRSKSCKDLVAQLTTDKFNEERDDSIVEALGIFREKLSLKNIRLVYDIAPSCQDDPKVGLERFLSSRMNGARETLIEFGRLRIYDFVVHRDEMAEYVADLSAISEWVGLFDYAQRLEQTKLYDERLVTYTQLPLKEGVEMKGAYLTQLALLEQNIQASLDETFEWLMTQ